MHEVYDWRELGLRCVFFAMHITIGLCVCLGVSDVRKENVGEAGDGNKGPLQRQWKNWIYCVTVQV
jgi:hypothetical protein